MSNLTKSKAFWRKNPDMRLKKPGFRDFYQTLRDQLSISRKFQFSKLLGGISCNFNWRIRFHGKTRFWMRYQTLKLVLLGEFWLVNAWPSKIIIQTTTSIFSRFCLVKLQINSFFNVKQWISYQKRIKIGLW